MRHRISNFNTGLGNPEECLLPNTWSRNYALNEVTKEIFDAALNLKSLKGYGGFDFEVKDNKSDFSVNFGYEPAYQGERLLIYHIDKDKTKCQIAKGIAKGAYGSDIKMKIVSYKKDIEFKKLIDKWHDRLINSVKGES